MRGMRCTQGLFFMLRLWCSYMCMLAVMTYNVGVLLAVVLGLASAYFILGFSPTEIVVIQTPSSKAIAYH